MAKTGINLVATVFFLLMCNGVAQAGNNSGGAFHTWPDTGQTKCYNGTVEISCSAAGQPFNDQDAQYNGPARSYTLLGGGTMVQDNVTGLIWEMKNSKDGTSNYSNPNDADNFYTWCDLQPDTNGGNAGTCGTNDTTDFINQLNSGAGFGSYTNWRLPTTKELATLTDLGRLNPAIDQIFAPTTQSSRYWSSTTYANGSNVAWLVSFYFGSGYYGYKSSGCYVRAVRGGQ